MVIATGLLEVRQAPQQRHESGLDFQIGGGIPLY